MQERLSDIEQKILDYIVDYLRMHTYQPSIREIGQRFGIRSTKSVSEHLQALADKGYVERDSARSRGVKIVDLDLTGSDSVSVPLYGKIAAGTPALIPDHVKEEFGFDRRLVEGEGTFLLEVRGDSMQGVGVFDGDLVLITPAAESDLIAGEIVAARIDGEGAVKRYFDRPGGAVLEAANPEYPPILVNDHDDFAILGRVTGLYRRMERPSA